MSDPEASVSEALRWLTVLQTTIWTLPNTC